MSVDKVVGDLDSPNKSNDVSDASSNSSAGAEVVVPKFNVRVMVP